MTTITGAKLEISGMVRFRTRSVLGLSPLCYFELLNNFEGARPCFKINQFQQCGHIILVCMCVKDAFSKQSLWRPETYNKEEKGVINKKMKYLKKNSDKFTKVEELVDYANSYSLVSVCEAHLYLKSKSRSLINLRYLYCDIESQLSRRRKFVFSYTSPSRYFDCYLFPH